MFNFFLVASLRLLDTYASKIAKKDGLLAELHARMSRGCRCLQNLSQPSMVFYMVYDMNCHRGHILASTPP